ncbi:Mu-like prophage major head subunit gpT family protein [Burkholderia pseudomallei]
MFINAQVLADLRTMVSGKFNEGTTLAQANAPKVATYLNSGSSRNVYPQFDQWPGFREWTGDRQFGDITAGAYAIDNVTYESSVEIKREDIEDDNLGLLAHMALAQGQATVTHADELVFPLFSAGFTAKGGDGATFFSADHAGPGTTKQSNLIAGSATHSWFLVDNSKPLMPFIFQKRRDYTLTSRFNLNDENVFMQNVYQWGIDARVAAGFGAWQTIVGAQVALDAAGYAEARQMMGSFMSTKGRPMLTQGKLLVCGPALEGAAREVLKADRNAAGATNVWAGTADLLVVPYL